MFLAVPNRLGIALVSLEAVPILTLDADDISFAAPEAPLLDMGLLEGGREKSIMRR